MTIAAGAHLGPYEILSALGAGGMGEVYRAKDPRLGRDVAIKVLPAAFSADPDRLRRFEQEARATAALNHPNILTVHEIGTHDGQPYIVSELLDGQTLRDALGHGALPVKIAIEHAIEICRGLAVAHEKGIVHRDLKPENVFVTTDGRIKILDFGLAKLTEAAVAGAGATMIATHTETSPGLVMGTIGYMSPEQVRGQAVDHRSDIFSLGSMLYEMLSGVRVFPGDTAADTISAILGTDPPELTIGRVTISPGLERIVRHCLEKLPGRRFQSATDVAFALETLTVTAESPATAPAGAPTESRWRERAGWIAAAALLVTLALLLWPTPWRGRPLPAGDVVRFAVYPPEGTVFTGSYYTTVQVPQFALSPDGRAIVFAAAPVGARPMLWLRSIEDVTARPLPGTEDAAEPFWSPDSRWVAFFAEGKVKKIPAAGGAVQVAAEGAVNAFGGTWGRDDTILFGYGNNAIRRVPAAGGTVKFANNLDASHLDAEGGHRWPQFLPDGRHFLLTVRGTERRGVFAASLDGDTKKFLVRVDSSAVYALPGYLLWVDGDTLLGQAFDQDHLELSGHPLTVAERVGRSSAGEGAVSASSTGTLAYAGALLRHSRLTWFDRAGNSLDSVPGDEGDYPDFRLSPDEKRLAASLVDPKTNYPDIWLTDLARNRPSRFTFGAFNASAVWSPDGTRLVFRTLRRGVVEFYQKSAFGGGNEEPLLSEEAQRAAGAQGANLVPSDWSPDGRQIIYADPEMASGFDLWLFPLAANAKPVKLLGSASDEIHGNFSPDGRFLAYSSNESGRFQVYVQTFPLSDRKWQVSTTGGYEPRWRGDGHEIYYLADDRKLMAVSITAGPSFDVPTRSSRRGSLRASTRCARTICPRATAGVSSSTPKRRRRAHSYYGCPQLDSSAEEMSVTQGARLGAYEILVPLGRGGMGEVYRARDTKLGRDVALKILPESFTHDPERIARFKREAHVLASLNHPHVGAIYGLDEANGQQFLVLELIDGETLADRIANGPLPVDEALAIARQIAEALEAAHEKGIIRTVHA